MAEDEVTTDSHWRMTATYNVAKSYYLAALPCTDRIAVLSTVPSELEALHMY